MCFWKEHLQAPLPKRAHTQHTTEYTAVRAFVFVSAMYHSSSSSPQIICMQQYLPRSTLTAVVDLYQSVCYTCNTLYSSISVRVTAKLPSRRAQVFSSVLFFLFFYFSLTSLLGRKKEGKAKVPPPHGRNQPQQAAYYISYGTYVPETKVEHIAVFSTVYTIVFCLS